MGLLVPFTKYSWPSKYDNPLQNQVKTVKFMLANKRGFILSTMGTGKTLSCLWFCDLLYVNTKITKVLIVAPLSTLQSVWADEIFFNFLGVPFTILHGSKQERIKRLDSGALYYIINHDGIKVIEQELRDKRFDVIIIDELTAYKNARSDRTKCMKRIADGSKTKQPAVYGLTGSITANSPLDAFGQARTVNPNNPKLPKYYGRFRDLLTTKFDEFTYIPRLGWENILKPMLYPSIRFTMDECIDLPPIVYETRQCDMTKEQTRVYKDLKNDYIAQYNDGLITAANAGVKVLKLLQVSCGAVIDKEGTVQEFSKSPKLKIIQEVHEQLDRKKLIIFVLFKASIKQVEEFLKSKKISCGVISGDIPMKKRSQVFDSFQRGDLEVIIIQPSAAAHGLTLTAASTVIWYTPVPSNEIYIQANARVRRPGQKYRQLVIRLESSPVERKMYKALDNKDKMSNTLLSMFQE